MQRSRIGSVARISDALVVRAIEILMKDRGVIQAELSRRSKLSESKVSRMMDGGSLRPDNIGAVLEGLGADAYDLARALDRAEGREPQLDAVAETSVINSDHWPDGSARDRTDRLVGAVEALVEEMKKERTR